MLSLFAQNWPHPLVFCNYVSLACMAYLAFAIALLSDTACNRARGCTRGINGLAPSLGRPSN